MYDIKECNVDIYIYVKYGAYIVYWVVHWLITGKIWLLMITGCILCMDIYIRWRATLEQNRYVT